MGVALRARVRVVGVTVMVTCFSENKRTVGARGALVGSAVDILIDRTHHCIAVTRPLTRAWGTFPIL